jgi:hypothetical protein
MIEYELKYQIVTVSQLFSSNIFKAIDNLEEIFDREHSHHGKAKYNWPPCTVNSFNILGWGGRKVMGEKLKVVWSVIVLSVMEQHVLKM